MLICNSTNWISIKWSHILHMAYIPKTVCKPKIMDRPTYTSKSLESPTKNMFVYTHAVTNNNTDSVPMKWKTSTSDFIPIGCEATDSNKETSDLDNDENEVNQPTTNNQHIRTSNRRKKLPPTRSHDFLWE